MLIIWVRINIVVSNTLVVTYPMQSVGVIWYIAVPCLSVTWVLRQMYIFHHRDPSNNTEELYSWATNSRCHRKLLQRRPTGQRGYKVGKEFNFPCRSWHFAALSQQQQIGLFHQSHLLDQIGWGNEKKEEEKPFAFCRLSCLSIQYTISWPSVSHCYRLDCMSTWREAL